MTTLTKIPVDIERQVFDYVGTGSPATILANAPAGATYRQIDGGSASMIWQKTTAGWEALGSATSFPWASITGKPTTIAGYGITDFNSLGDARWILASGETRAFATSSNITTGGVLGFSGATARIVGVAAGLSLRNAANNADNVLITDAGAVTIRNQLNVASGNIQQVTIQGAPTGNVQIFIGSSSVFGVRGSMFSSGYQFISYNAYQDTLSTDSWTQSLSTNPSGLFEVRPDGVAYYSAIAGKAVGNKATFWTSQFSIIGGNGVLTGTLSVNGALTAGAVTSNGPLISAGNAGLPANTAGNLYMASGYSSPVTGRIFVGDGSGWRLNFAKRASSVLTDLFIMEDNGNFTASVGQIFAEAYFSVTRSTTAKAYFGIALAANSIINGTTQDDIAIRSVLSGSRILFSVDNGASACVTFGSAHSFIGNVTFANNISVGGTLVVTGLSTVTDLHATGTLQQQKGTATLYDVPTFTVSSSAPPGSSSGYPTGHEWIQVTAPI